MRRLLAVGTAACVGATLAGCGTGPDEREARRVAERLYTAVARHQGEAACAALAAPTIQSLEQQEGKPCPQAVTSLKLSGPGAARARVFETNASVTFASGEIAFLDHTRQGWRVSAAGCKPMGQGPADCEVQD